MALQFLVPPTGTYATEPNRSQVASEESNLTPKIELNDILGQFGNGSNVDLQANSAQQAFGIYLKNRFLGTKNGEISLEKIKLTHEIMAGNPELAKPKLKRVLWKDVRIGYGMPDSTRAALESISKATGRWKALLLNPQANIGEWLKLKLNNQTFVTEELFQKLITEKLLATLNKKDRTNLEVLEAYKVELFKMKHELGDAAFQRLWQGLIHLTAATEVDTQAALKSPDGMVALNGIKGFIAERDRLAQVHLHISFDQLNPAGDKEKSPIPSNQSLNERMSTFEQDTKAQAKSESRSERTVRSLSLAESGFRSCLADDCASQTYFEKAFDPNFLYFTKQVGEEGWQGHITVVLGTATSKAGQKKVAFVDKIQMIDNADLPGMLESVRRILQDFGYEICIPNNLGSLNGISNHDHTRKFLKSMPSFAKQDTKYRKFIPHPSPYDFPNGYSRAYGKLTVRPLLPLPEVQTEQFEMLAPIETVDSEQAPVSLWTLIESSFALKNGSMDEHLRYIATNELLDTNDLPIDPDFYETIDRWLKDSATHTKLRFRAMTFLLRRNNRFIESYLPYFSKNEVKNLVQNWAQKEELNKLATEKDIFWRIYLQTGSAAVPVKTIWTDVQLSNETWSLFKDPETLTRMQARVQMLGHPYQSIHYLLPMLIQMEAYKTAIDRDMIDSARELEGLIIAGLDDVLNQELDSVLAEALEDPNSPADEAIVTKLLQKKIESLKTANFKSKMKLYRVLPVLAASAGLTWHMLALDGSTIDTNREAIMVMLEILVAEVGVFGGLLNGLFHLTNEESKTRPLRKKKIQRLKTIWEKDIETARSKLKSLKEKSNSSTLVTVQDKVAHPIPRRENSLWARLQAEFTLRTSGGAEKIEYINANRINLENNLPVDPEFDGFVLDAAKDGSNRALQKVAIDFLAVHDAKKISVLFNSLSDSDLAWVHNEFFKSAANDQEKYGNFLWKLYAAQRSSTLFTPDALSGADLPPHVLALFKNPTVRQRIDQRIKQTSATAKTFVDTTAFGKAMEFVVLTEVLKAAVDLNLPLSADVLEDRAGTALDEMLSALSAIRGNGRQVFSQLIGQTIRDDDSPVDDVLVAKLLNKKFKALGWRHAWAKATNNKVGTTLIFGGMVGIFGGIIGMTANEVAGSITAGCSMIALLGGFTAVMHNAVSVKRKSTVEKYKALKDIWSAQSKELKKLSKAKGSCSCLSAP